MLRKAIASALALVLLGSCADMKKEDIGMVAGTILGAVLGNQIGQGNGRVIGTLIGAAAGGLLGKQFGSYLDEQDRKRIEEATYRSLDNGQKAVYVSPKSGAVVTMSPAAARYEMDSEVPVAAYVDTSRPLIREQAVYQTVCPADLKSGPTAVASTLKVLPKEQPVTVTAVVRDSDWALVTENAVAVGYVNKREISSRWCLTNGTSVAKAETKAKPVAKKPASVATKTQKPTQPQTAPVKPIQNEQPVTTMAQSQPPIVATPAASTAPAGSTPTIADTPSVTKVALQTQCKVITRTIEVPNGGPTGKEDLKFCQRPPPQWKLINV